MSTPAVLRMRRDTAANWTSNDPTLEDGQLGFETDTGLFKLGDGSTAWTALSYVGPPGGDFSGPASATDGAPVLFDGTTGKLGKNSTPTGTGNPVLATSPTLVTPNIGTPSAGVLTNCTGLPNGSVIGLGSAALVATSAFEAAGGIATHAAVTSSVHGISTFGATLVDDADAATARATLELVQVPTYVRLLDADTAATSTGTGAQPWFPSNGSVTLPSNKAYTFVGMIALSRGASVSVSGSFGGTASVTVLYRSIGQSAVVGTQGTAQTSSWRNSTSATISIPSSTNPGWLEVRGVLRVTTGGTFIPQFQFSASASSSTIYAGTYFELTELGADTFTSRGTWS